MRSDDVLEKQKAFRIDIRCAAGLGPHSVVYLHGYPHRLMWKVEPGSSEWWAYRLTGFEWLAFKTAEFITHLRARWTLR